jgi:hypothetical protein
MAHDYEDAVNLDQMPDRDVRDLIHQRLDEGEEFDVDAVEIHVEGGHVRVEGRVGTEGERQHVEQILSSLGAQSYDNNVVVDPLAREQRAEAADIARVEDAATTSGLGEAAAGTTDTAEHLRPDDAGEMYGTRDPQKAVEEGKSYTPPDGPLQEGIEGDERH